MAPKSFVKLAVFTACLMLIAASASAQRQKIVPPNPNDFVTITAGDYHTCATKVNGYTYCWGWNGLGQVGTSNSSTCSNCVDRPRVVITGTKNVDAGRDHTCALSTDGVASCWGNSNYGQLGGGFYGSLSSPNPVSGGLVFSSLSAGQSSTCGTTANGMYCWGAIVDAVHGTPSPYRVLSWNGYNNVTVGYLHGCAVYVSGSWREGDCWGNNRFGQIGADPAQLPNAPPTILSSFGTAVWRMSTQADFTCADQVNGIVQCVGYNYWGQLGNGTYSNNYQAQTVAGASYGVATGPNHACALNSSNALLCWGNGYWGQLGNGATGVFPTAQTVAGGRTYRAVAPGLLHTCAIGTDNHIYCWGDNRYGQVGVGWPGSWYSTPVQAIDP